MQFTHDIDQIVAQCVDVTHCQPPRAENALISALSPAIGNTSGFLNNPAKKGFRSPPPGWLGRQ
jgi:hypothetical protein